MIKELGLQLYTIRDFMKNEKVRIYPGSDS